MWARIFSLVFATLWMADSLPAQSLDVGCQFRLEVFLDRSGSVQQRQASGKSDYQEVLGSLEAMLATSKNHLLDDDDQVVVEHFPRWETKARSWMGPKEVAEGLSALAANPPPTTPFTDLEVPLGRILTALSTPQAAHRRIFLIVSDFVDEPEVSRGAESERDLKVRIERNLARLKAAFPNPSVGAASDRALAATVLPLAGSQSNATNPSSPPGRNILLLYVLPVGPPSEVQKQKQFLDSLKDIHLQTFTKLRDLEDAIIQNSYRLTSEVIWDAMSEDDPNRKARITLYNRNCSNFTLCQVWIECQGRDKVFSPGLPVALKAGETLAVAPVRLGASHCSAPMVGVSGRYGAATGVLAHEWCQEPSPLLVFEEIPLVGDGSPPEMRAVQAVYQGGWLHPGRLQLNLELRGRYQGATSQAKIELRALGLESAVKLAPIQLPPSLSQGCEGSVPPRTCLDAKSWHPFRCTLEMGRQALPKFAFLPLEAAWAGSSSESSANPYERSIPSLSSPTVAAVSIPALLWAISLVVVWLTGENLAMATVASMVTIVGASSFAFGADYLINPVAGFEDFRRVLFHPYFLLCCMAVVCLCWGLLNLRRHRLEFREWRARFFSFFLPFAVCASFLGFTFLFCPRLLGEFRQHWGEDQAPFKFDWGIEDICEQGQGQ